TPGKEHQLGTSTLEVELNQGPPWADATSAVPPGSRPRSRWTADGLRHHLCLAGVAMLLVAAPFGVPEAATGPEGAQGPQGLTGAAPVFEAYRGQADPQVQFLARGARYTAFLTSTEMVLGLGPDATIRLKPIGTARAD